MIIKIDPRNYPFAADLEFPRGLAKGETVSIRISVDNIEKLMIPAADNIYVDSRTKVIHIAKNDEPVVRTLALSKDTSVKQQANATPVKHILMPPPNSQSTANQEVVPPLTKQTAKPKTAKFMISGPPPKRQIQTASASKPKEIKVAKQTTTNSRKFCCEKCPEWFTSKADLLSHSEICEESSMTRGVIDVDDNEYELIIDELLMKNDQAEMTIRQGKYNAILSQKPNQPQYVTVTCLETVPEYFSNACFDIVTKLFHQNMIDLEGEAQIKSETFRQGDRLKVTQIQLCGNVLFNKVPTDVPSVYQEFKSFIQSCIQTEIGAKQENISEGATSENNSNAPIVQDSQVAIKTEGSTQGTDPVEEQIIDNTKPSVMVQAVEILKCSGGDDVQEKNSGVEKENEIDVTGVDGMDIEEPLDQLVDEVTLVGMPSTSSSMSKFTCELCANINRRLRFQSEQELETHIARNHTVTIIGGPECSKCSKKFVTTEACTAHEKKCNPKHPKKCQMCDKNFAMGMQRDRHMREAHGIIKEHLCNLCGQKYQSEKHRDWHLVTKHKDELSHNELARIGMEEIQCTLCEYSTYSSKGMQVHRQKEHIQNEKMFRCPACGLADDTLHGIQEHIAKKHGEDDKWFVCHICNRTFCREMDDLIQDHLGYHERNDGYVCVYCNKLFESQALLADHSNRNHEKAVWRYICDICDAGTESYKELLKHMLKHNPFKTSLYRLQREHITKRNIEEGIISKKDTKVATATSHKCDLCGKKFDLEASLTSHKLVYHVDPGKEFYKCPICGKAFKPHHLTYHLRLHSDERPHKCQFCDAAFHTIASCQDHEVVKHTLAFKHHCPLCKKGFVSRGKTWQHLMRFHKKSSDQADKLLPPLPTKFKTILEKRKQTEEIKLLVESSITPIGSERFAMKKFRAVRNTRRTKVTTEGDDVFEGAEIGDELSQESEMNMDENVEEQQPDEEIAEEVLMPEKVGEVGVLTEEHEDIDPGCYPQPELGPDMYKVVLTDKRSAIIRLKPGDQVVMEDEHGQEHVIQLQAAVDEQDQLQTTAEAPQ